MPSHLYKKLFPRATKEQLVETQNKNVQLKTYNKTTITLLVIFKVKLEHNNVQKMDKFFVVQENGQALLGMSDIDMLIININCNTIDTHGNDSANNHSTDTAIHQSSKHVQHYTNVMQDVDRAEKSYTNIDTISKFEKR